MNPLGLILVATGALLFLGGGAKPKRTGTTETPPPAEGSGAPEGKRTYSVVALGQGRFVATGRINGAMSWTSSPYRSHALAEQAGMKWAGIQQGLGTLLAKKLAQAKSALCRRPATLSANEQLILRDLVAEPMYADYFPSGGWTDLDASILGLATKMLEQCGTNTSPGSLEAAKAIVTGLYWKHTGTGGAGGGGQ